MAWNGSIIKLVRRTVSEILSSLRKNYLGITNYGVNEAVIIASLIIPLDCLLDFQQSSSKDFASACNNYILLPPKLIKRLCSDWENLLVVFCLIFTLATKPYLLLIICGCNSTYFPIFSQLYLSEWSQLDSCA